MSPQRYRVNKALSSTYGFSRRTTIVFARLGCRVGPSVRGGGSRSTPAIANTVVEILSTVNYCLPVRSAAARLIASHAGHVANHARIHLKHGFSMTQILMRLLNFVAVSALVLLPVAGVAMAQAAGKNSTASASGSTSVGASGSTSAKPSSTTSATVPTASVSTGTKPTGASSSGSSGVGSAVPPSVSPSETAPPMDGSTYTVRLRDLEQRVNELKEQIRRSHTKLSLLSDTILGGGAAGSRATISFDNEMSGAFRLIRATILLDGAVQYSRSDDTGALASQKTIPLFDGSIPPGDHIIQIILELRGHGYGVFSYLRGYKFEIRSSHSFTVTDGKSVTLRSIAYEKGGVTTPLEQRPAMRYVENISSIESHGVGSVPGAPVSKPTRESPRRN